MNSASTAAATTTAITTTDDGISNNTVQQPKMEESVTQVGETTLGVVHHPAAETMAMTAAQTTTTTPLMMMEEQQQATSTVPEAGVTPEQQHQQIPPTIPAPQQQRLPSPSSSSSQPVTYYAMTKEQAILKAQQVMRDYKRPDRLELKLLQQQVAAQHYAAPPGVNVGVGVSGTDHGTVNVDNNSNNAAAVPVSLLPVPLKPPRARAAPSTPLEGVVDFLSEPNLETDDLFSVNPFGVHAHDVLSGRGAYVNGHIGNARLRALASERKHQFDSGNYTEKRMLAAEIVAAVKALDPPGRFLKKASKELLAEYQAQQLREAAAAQQQQQVGVAVPVPVAAEGEDSVKVETAQNNTNVVEMTKQEEATTTMPTTPTAAATTLTITADDAGIKEEAAAADTDSAVIVATTVANAAATKEEIGSAGVDALFKAAEKAQQTSQSPPLQQQESLQPSLIHLIDDVWEELSDDKAIHKACQVMRDISRPDRKYREERREQRIQRKHNKRRKLLQEATTVVTTGVDVDDGEGVATMDTGDAVVGEQGDAAMTNAVNVTVATTDANTPMASAEPKLEDQQEAIALAAMPLSETVPVVALVATYPSTVTATLAAPATTSTGAPPPQKVDEELTAEGKAAVQVVDNALLDGTNAASSSSSQATTACTTEQAPPALTAGMSTELGVVEMATTDATAVAANIDRIEV